MDPRVIYHNLNPHPALSPVPDPSNPSTAEEQKNHEAQYRQLLIQGALAVLLPTEDLENACLRTLVADVIADSILGNSIGGRVCDGWFIWATIAKVVGVVKARTESKATAEELEIGTRSRLEKFGLLSAENEVTDTERSKYNRRLTLSNTFWRILQYCYLAFMTVRFVILGVVTAYSQSSRSSTSKIPSATGVSPIATGEEAPRMVRPIVEFRMFGLISEVFDVSSRMPWVGGCLALLQQQLVKGPMRVGATNGILDQ